MTIEEAIFHLVSNDAGVTALLGSGTACRVYPKKLPQTPTLPAVVYHRIDTPREHSQQGASELAHPRFQFDCWAETRSGAKAVADAVRLALDGFQGSMGSAPGIDVSGAFAEDESDEYDDDVKQFMSRLDVIVWHEEV